MAASKKIDYDSIEPDWRAGIKSVQQLAEEYTKRTGIKVSHTAINKYFKKHGVSRDLSAKIRARAESKVSERMVSGRVSSETIIEANAEHIAVIDISHREDVRRLSGIEGKLLQEFEQHVGEPELLEQLGELMRSPDKSGQDKLNDLYRKVISFPGRVDSFKKMTETMRMRIDLERRIIKIDDQSRDTESIEDIIARINADN